MRERTSGGSAGAPVAGARLVRPLPLERVERRWPVDCASLFAPGDAGFRRVLGGPGTGKTSLVADVAVARIRDEGVDPESVLVLTQSRRAAVDMRERITAGLLARGESASVRRATREPLVRTVHSYAFAVLRLQASAHGNPPPRLLTSAEQDSIVREMLQGELADGAARWPEHLRPALGLSGFASEVRNLVLRAAERGLGPEDLVKLGRRHARPAWVAVGQFAAQYEQAMVLRGSVGVETPEATSPGLDAAELVGSALTAFATDPDLLARERARIRHVLVDDAQHLDPQAATIVRAVASGAGTVLVVGDPDQTVYSFRGADPAFLLEDPETRIVLTHNHRATAAVGAAAAEVARNLPGRYDHRGASGYRDDVVVDRSADPTADSVDDAVIGAAADPSRRTRAVAPARVVVTTSAAKEAAVVADTVRRAHLGDGVAWSQMAVIVRSVPRSAAPLRRALLAAGVPVVTSAAALPLSRQRGAASLLGVLRAVAASRSADPAGAADFTVDDAFALLEGPIGGADPLSLRRLRRGLRRAEVARGGDRDSADLVRTAVLGDGSSGTAVLGDGSSGTAVLGDGSSGTTSLDVGSLVDTLTDVEAAPLRRVRKVVRAAAAAVGPDGRRVEDALWAAWTATALERRWVAASARGGPLGAQADRDLDSVVALFDTAASYVDALPRSTLGGFVDHVLDQEIPATEGRRATVVPDAVRIVSAHAAAGREWDVVVVAGVQDGLWPALRPRGTLLGVEDLLDVDAGVTTAAGDVDRRLSRTAPLLAEERRLFLSACSRAREALLVTAVDSVTGGEETLRSRFVDELIASGRVRVDEGATGTPDGADRIADSRVLALPDIVAELRAVVCDETAARVDPGRHARAVGALARLAAAGIPGAHPDTWYGTGGASTTAALWVADGEDGEGGAAVALSPSTVEVLSTCPLRWALERHGGRDGDTVHAVTGNLVHTIVQAVAGRVPAEEVRRELDRAWSAVDLGSEWYSRRELARTAAMIDTFRDWMQRSRGELTEAGVEVPVDGVLEPRSPDEPTVRLRGRIDRLEHDPDGRPVVVDVKTGKNAVTKTAAAEHPQLATYQVALAAGAVEGEPAAEPGGGRLVYVAQTHRSTGAVERTQPAPTTEQLEEWRDTVVAAAAATRGPTFEARVNDGCRHCPVVAACPAQDRGRQVTEG
ncbi:ATP-dependent helicase [Rhodococcoides kroppenstedtii]|uniref:ATP-dependent helicase n=1 Tax=Rhodococcoides kroppenstedtii TaxID=293050 RepID=UPI00363EDDAC